MNGTATRTVFAIQSTAAHERGDGWWFRKTGGGRMPRRRGWVALEDATTWPSLADALRTQTEVDVSHGRQCTRVVELELALRVRGRA